MILLIGKVFVLWHPQKAEVIIRYSILMSLIFPRRDGSLFPRRIPIALHILCWTHISDILDLQYLLFLCFSLSNAPGGTVGLEIEMCISNRVGFYFICFGYTKKTLHIERFKQLRLLFYDPEGLNEIKVLTYMILYGVSLLSLLTPCSVF